MYSWLFALFSLVYLCDARTLTPWKSRLKECEKTTCKDLELDDPNCILKCVSMQCWKEIYTEPMEPGEVDFGRRRLFDSCVQREDANTTRGQHKPRLAKGVKAETQDDEVLPDPNGVSSFV